MPDRMKLFSYKTFSLSKYLYFAQTKWENNKPVSFSINKIYEGNQSFPNIRPW